jgi:hypothetical protein
LTGRRRLVVIAATALVALAVAGVVALPEILRRVVVWRVAAATGRTVTLAALELNLFEGRLALREFRIADRDQSPLAAIARLEVRFRSRDLLRGRLRVLDAALQAPTVRIVRTGPSEFNVSDLLARKTGGGSTPAVTIDRFELRDGAVTIEDRTLAPPRTWRVERVTLSARGLSTLPDAPPGVVTFSAVAAGSPVSLWVSGVRLSPPAFHATLIAREIDASLAALYLPPGSPLSPARGRLDATATIEQSAAAGTRVSLDAVFGGVELQRPGQAAAFLTAPAVRVTVEDLRLKGKTIELGRLAVDGGRVVLEDTRLGAVRRWQAEGIALEAKNLSSARGAPPGVATLRAVVAGSPLSVWVGNLRLAPLELHATAIVRNVDFALFKLYVPPDLPVQPEHGVLNATVSVEHDAQRGTRLALDAALSDVEVRRPAHFVTAPALRVIAEDIAYAGGAVTVGRVAVDGERLTLEDRTLRPARTWAVQDLAVEARGLSSRRQDVQGVITARATVAGAAVSAWITQVRLDPLELRATAILRNLDLALVQLYLPPAVPLLLDRGVVNASVQVDHDAGQGTRLTGDVTLTGVEARGRGAADHLAVSAPSLRVAVADARQHENTLDVGRLELTASVSLVDGRGAVPARLDLPRVALSLQDLRWPSPTPARVKLDAALGAGGTVAVDGTVSGESADVDLRLVVADAELAAIQPYLPFRAGLQARAGVKLAITGPILPKLRLRARGDATLRGLAMSDGARPVLTLERMRATGIDLTFPERLAIEKVRMRRSWALIERDAQGNFLLRTLLARTSVAERAAPPAAAFEFHLGEGIFEEGAVTIVDAATTPPARFEIAGARLVVNDFAWPARGPVKLQLTSPTPGGGKLAVGGTLTLDPGRLDARATLDGVELAPAQPYLPIEGRVAGRVSGDLAVKLAFDPLAVQVSGQARLQRFTLSDGDRPLVTAGRAEAVGIDVDWPRRVALQRFLLRAPRLLIERNAQDEVTLPRLVTPRWPAKAPADPAPAQTTPAASQPGAPRPLVEIGTVRLERGSGRFVDETFTPPFAEELSRVDVTVTGLTTAPGRLARFTGGGAFGGGGTFTLEGEAVAEERSITGLKLDIREYLVARANPYLQRYTGWTATRGTLSASAGYTLKGTQLDARHDVIARQLEVERAGESDEVERRLGLPLGFLVSLLKDARGEIRLSVPVSGDISTRAFDFHEAVWGAVRALGIRLIALPFSKIGSLFFSEDSKVQGVALTPLVFEAGTATLAPAMAEHLDRVATFLKDAPSVNLRLVPILVQADLDALKRARVAAGQPEDLPPDALHDLGTRRLDAVRQGLSARGGVEVGRLGGTSPRVPLVEGGSAARVELDLRS